MEPMVTDIEKKRYTEQVGTELRTLAQPAPTTIWHYTSGNGFLSILRSHSIWTTHISCLNDATEVRYASSIFREALQSEWEGAETTEAEWCLLGALHERLDADVRLIRWFVTCFSKMEDDLSQWRAYGGGEGGYAIGFDTTKMLDEFNESNCIIAPVIYGRDQQMQTSRRLIIRTWEAYRQGLADRPGIPPLDWAYAFIDVWFDLIEMLFPLFKDAAFSSEHEWRIIRSLQPNDLENMQFQQRQTMLSRHVPMIAKPRPQRDGRLLPINRIMVGPSRFKEISMVSVADLLRTLKYPDGSVHVQMSTVPYQTP